MMKTHLYVVEFCIPSLKLGLSCSLNPLRNQCTVCFSVFGAREKLFRSSKEVLSLLFKLEREHFFLLKDSLILDS